MSRNPKSNLPQHVTREDVRRIPSYALATDEEADELIISIRQFVSILINFHQQDYSP